MRVDGMNRRIVVVGSGSFARSVSYALAAELRTPADVLVLARDPDKAADDFVRFVPEWKGKEGAVKFAFNMYAKLDYPGQKERGEVNAERLPKLQEFYVAKGFIQKATPVDELYTNEFIKKRAVRCRAARETAQ